MIIKLRGSVHKFKNEGRHNADDFTFSNFLQTVNDLKNLTEIEPEQIPLNNLEFGVNIPLPYLPKYFIKDLLVHRNNRFNLIDLPRMIYAQAVHDKYMVKVYDKGRQFNCGNVLRFELKYIRMQKLNKMGIRTLTDLMNVDVWNILGNLLRREFKQIIFSDSSINYDEVPERDKKNIQEMDNPKYWERSMNRATKLKRKKKFSELVSKYGDRGYESIGEMIIEKVNVLSGKDRQEIPNSQNENQHCSYQSKSKRSPRSGNMPEIVKSKRSPILAIGGERKPIFLTELKQDSNQPANKKSKSYPNIRLKTEKKTERINNVEKRRKCLVTGIDISMQRKHSKLLQIVGLRHLKKNTPGTYQSILRSFMPRSGYAGKRTKHEHDEISHLAKQIRNVYFNPKQYQNKMDHAQIRMTF